MQGSNPTGSTKEDSIKLCVLWLLRSKQMRNRYLYWFLEGQNGKACARISHKILYLGTIMSFGNQARKPQFVCELVIAEKWPITYDKDACGVVELQSCIKCKTILSGKKNTHSWRNWNTRSTKDAVPNGLVGSSPTECTRKLWAYKTKNPPVSQQSRILGNKNLGQQRIGKRRSL